MGRRLRHGSLPVQPSCAVRILDGIHPSRGHARTHFVRRVVEGAEDAATALYCVHYGSYAGQRIVMRQTNREGRFPFAMPERQCPECGGELGLALRPSQPETANLAAPYAVTRSSLWRCSTCGHTFTAEQVRHGKRVRSKAPQSP